MYAEIAIAKQDSDFYKRKNCEIGNAASADGEYIIMTGRVLVGPGSKPVPSATNVFQDISTDLLYLDIPSDSGQDEDWASSFRSVE